MVSLAAGRSRCCSDARLSSRTAPVARLSDRVVVRSSICLVARFSGRPEKYMAGESASRAVRPGYSIFWGFFVGVRGQVPRGCWRTRVCLLSAVEKWGDGVWGRLRSGDKRGTTPRFWGVECHHGAKRRHLDRAVSRQAHQKSKSGAMAARIGRKVGSRRDLLPIIEELGGRLLLGARVRSPGPIMGYSSTRFDARNADVVRISSFSVSFYPFVGSELSAWERILALGERASVICSRKMGRWRVRSGKKWGQPRNYAPSFECRASPRCRGTAAAT